jgi:uncharacterized protein
MENIEIINNLQNLRFELKVQDEIAFLEYRWHEGKLALMHTLVPEKFEGHGTGGQLVKAAFEYAEKEGFKIIVYCPFVASYLDKHPEYKVLVDKER